MDKLISGIDILNADCNLLRNQDIIIRGDRIEAIENHPNLVTPNVDQIYEGKGKLLVPGFINSHLHSHDRFDKGRLDNLPLELWMVAYNCPLGMRNWTAEDCYLRTMLNCIEQLKSGVTSVIDDVFHSDITSEDNIDAVFQAYEDSGLRAKITIAWSDLPYYESIPFLSDILPINLKKELYSKLVERDYVLNLWKNFYDRYKDRVSFAISTSAPHRCSDNFLREATDFAKKINVPVIIHTLETKTQQITGYLKYGSGMVEHMYDLNLLGPETNLVHCVWLNDQEIDIIAESGARVIHNPVSNLKLGSGIAPISKIVSSGIPVGLGTDNNNCNDSANLLEAMKIAALIGKVTSGSYKKWVGAKEAFQMATIGGAACFGNQEIGNILPGYKADFSIFNIDSLNFFPEHNRLYQLIFGENGNSLDSVFIDGKPVVEKSTIISINENKIKDKLIDRENEILDIIASSSSRVHEILPYVKQAYDLCINLASISSLEWPKAHVKTD